MKESKQWPSGVTESQVESLLAAISGDGNFYQRIDFFSHHFLGLPYLLDSLVGAHDVAEEYVANFTALNCVTYIETVLALAWSRDVNQFADKLRMTRYRQGRVDWLERNHYSVDWIQRNQEAGFVHDITPKTGCFTITKELSYMQHYPVRQHQLRFLHKEKVNEYRNWFRTGDLVYFGSHLENMDMFHVGLLVWRQGALKLRHSANSKGGVVEENLVDYCIETRERKGLQFVRPQFLLTR